MRAGEIVFNSVVAITIACGVCFFIFNVRSCTEKNLDEISKCIAATQKPLECQKAFPQ